jgi:hypothetical protein
MPQSSLFRGLAIIAIAASAAVAQSRIYTAGSGARSGQSFNDNSRNSGGSTVSNSNQGGMVTSAAGAGSAASGRSAPAQPTEAAATTPQQNTRVNPNRPTFIAVDPERERLERERHHRRRDAFVQGQTYYPVYTNPPDDTEYYTNYTSFTDQQQQQPVAEPEAPAPTIFENRPGYQAPPIRAYQPSSPPANETSAGPMRETYQTSDEGQRTSAVDPQPTTILVFRDGHQLEIGNYAIVGDTLYNMAGVGETHKISLADLDLDKTVQVNRARGYDFRLPKRPS